MKHLSLLFVSGLLALPLAATAELRTWTNSSGKEITAEITALSGDEITLKLESGRAYTFPLASLSAEDQEFARNWQTGQAALADAPAPRTETILAVPGKVLYSDSLTGISGDWKMPHGEWSAGDEGLSGAERAADDHAAVMKRAQVLKDVIIEFDVRLGEASRVMFGIDDNKDHVCRVTLTPDSFQAQKDDNDHEGPDLAKPFNRVEERLDPEDWHTVRIELVGEEMVAQTGDLISLGSDPLLATEKAKWGFIVSGPAAEFRDLTIWEASLSEDGEKNISRLKRRLDVED